MLVVAIGVMLAVFSRGYINGIMVDMIEQTARFNSGHVKVITKAYSENLDQIPNDLALMQTGNLKESLENDFPGHCRNIYRAGSVVADADIRPGYQPIHQKRNNRDNDEQDL